MFPTAEAFQQLRVTNRFHVHFGLKLKGGVCVQSANKSLSAQIYREAYWKEDYFRVCQGYVRFSSEKLHVDKCFPQVFPIHLGFYL